MENIFGSKEIIAAMVYLASMAITYFGARQKNKVDFDAKLLESQNKFIDNFQEEARSMREEITELRNSLKSVMLENTSLQKQVTELTRINYDLQKQITELTRGH
jgi:peptidoglycan hydrolase CwlO-like protein